MSMEKVLMVNTNPNHDKFGMVEEFTPVVAESNILQRQGWVRQSPVEPTVDPPVESIDPPVKTITEPKPKRKAKKTKKK